MHPCVQVVFDPSRKRQVVSHELDSSTGIPGTDEIKVAGNFLTVVIALVL